MSFRTKRVLSMALVGALASGLLPLDSKASSADATVLAPIQGTSVDAEYRLLDLDQAPKQQTTTKVITGVITDEAGEPLAGAKLKIAGKVSGISDVHGKFTLKNVSAGASVEVSFIGFSSQKFVVKAGTTHYKIKMKSSAKMTEEVTVIGYGERNTKNIIGSVAQVKGDAIKEIPSSSLENLLQGRMAGVEITNSSGAPGGGGAIIAIRGYNSMIDQNTLRLNDYGDPLYVIDGVPVQGFSSPITGTNTLSSIDPSTIESIEVLKDAASAAIYGSRAGRGVILITTKKGREGKARFSANVSYSISHLPLAPMQTGGKAVRDYLNKADENMRRPYKDPSTKVSRFPENKIDAFGVNKLGGVYGGPWARAIRGYAYNPDQPAVASALQDSLNPLYNNSTNWYAYAFRPAQVLNANLQASGGSEKFNYLIGLGVYDEKGIAKGSDFTRINYITNLSAQPIKNLTVDSRFSISYTGRHRGGSTGGSRIETLSVDPRKASSLAPGHGSIIDEMLKATNLTSERNENYDFRGSFYMNYQFLPGLTFKSSASAHMAIQALNVYQPAAIAEARFNTTQGMLDRSLGLTNENLLTFNRSFDETHNLEVLLGQSFEHRVANNLHATGFGSVSDKIHYIYKGFPQLPPEGSATNLRIMQHAFTDRLEQALVSTFGRLAYNYKYRYLMEFTLRRDGSSVFGSRNKYAVFPALALGWAFSDEPFMRRAWWLNHGKFRLSWGRSGETYPDPYRAFGLLLPDGEYNGRPAISVDNSLTGGMINRELKWVLHDQVDLGVDLSFLDHRLKIKADAYYRRSHGILFPTKLPKFLYLYEHQTINANDAVNRGLELEVQGDIFRPEDPRAFSWRTRFNISHNDNYLLSTFDGRDVGLSTSIPIHMLGRGLYLLYAFVDGPVYPTNDAVPDTYDTAGNRHKYYLASKEYPFGAGMKALYDLNGDTRVDVLDRRLLGTTLPFASGGWANEFRYKDFDLTALVTFAIKRKMINVAKWQSISPKEAASKPILADISKLKFWEKPGDENEPGTLPLLSLWDDTMIQYHGLMASNLEDVSYFKLKTVTLGYTLPTELAKKIHLSGLRLFLTGENLLTLTNYSGPDPETVPLIGPGAGQDEYKAYPLARKVTLGMTVNF